MNSQSIQTMFYRRSKVCTKMSVSLTERNELSRKFKYYFSSVRPTAPENFVSGQNGTFFTIATEIHLLSTAIRGRSLLLDAVVSFSWSDDRLMLRELSDRFELPPEFTAWLPRARTSPAPHSQSLFLAPTTGIVTWYHRVKDSIPCASEPWKHPFASLDCEFLVENIGDEILTIVNLRDMRAESQTANVGAELARFPSSSLLLSFRSEWQSAILSVYLPSLLVISLVFFAQWKRRKVQVLVSTAALVCLLVMLSSSRPVQGTTLLDLWLSGCFLHAAFLLAVDLTLPARRVRYSLMVPVERPERPPIQIMTKANIATNRFVASLERFASRTLGTSRSQSTTTELVTACPGELPIQRHVTTATLGERKRLALLAIAASYLTFLVIYLLLALSIQ